MQMKDDTLCNNFYTLQIMLKEITNSLIKLFKEKHKLKTSLEWNDTTKEGKLFYKTHQNYMKIDKTQTLILTNGNSAEYDLSLLVQIFKLKEYHDSNIFNHLDKVRTVRNCIAHNSKCEVSDSDYAGHFTSLQSCLISLGFSQEEVDKLKQSVLNSKFKQDMSDIAKEYSELKNEGNKHFKEANYSNAIEYYSQALKIEGLAEKDKAILYSNTANSFFELHKKSKREEDLDRSMGNAKLAISIDPGYVKCYFRIGKIHEVKEKLEKALNYYKKCLELDSSNEEVKNAIANLILRTRERDRTANLFSDSFPKSIEEQNEEDLLHMQTRIGNIVNKSSMMQFGEFIKDKIPGFRDVCKGHEYRDGSENCKQNYEMAARFYSKALQKKNAEAAYNLGLLYETGRGVAQSFSTAITFFEIAANSNPVTELDGDKSPTVGVAEGQHALALCYMDGVYVKRNPDLAIQWYEKAVSNGSHHSANNLGLIYLSGKHVKKDLKKAEKLLLFSYSQNNQQALPNLVDLYLEMEMPEKALMWHERALEKGCLFSISRDKDVKHLLDIMNKDFESTGIPKWEQKLNLEFENFSFQERANRFNDIITTNNHQTIKDKKITDPFEINLIVDHRKRIQKFNTLNKQNIHPLYSVPNTKIPNDYNKNNLKQIFLKDIDTNEDKILNGYFLIVSNIDLPDIPAIKSHSTFFIIQDENANIQRLALYNFKGDINTHLSFGSKFRINNPYMRLAADGKPMIRVDNPDSIEIVEYKNKICRRCFKEDCKMHCSKCKVAFYCSKECQQEDWKIFCHSSICN